MYINENNIKRPVRVMAGNTYKSKSTILSIQWLNQHTILCVDTEVGWYDMAWSNCMYLVLSGISYLSVPFCTCIHTYIQSGAGTCYWYRDTVDGGSRRTSKDKNSPKSIILSCELWLRIIVFAIPNAYNDTLFHLAIRCILLWYFVYLAIYENFVMKPNLLNSES